MTDTKREWLPVPEWQRRNPGILSKNTLYDAVAKKRLMSIRIGGKILIASDALDVLSTSGAYRDSLDRIYGEKSEQLTIRTTNDAIDHILAEQQAGVDRE